MTFCVLLYRHFQQKNIGVYTGRGGGGSPAISDTFCLKIQAERANIRAEKRERKREREREREEGGIKKGKLKMLAEISGMDE